METVVQLFLLPFAGGNSASFNEMVNYLDPRIEPLTIEYSGRLSRNKDGYITNYKDFLIDVALSDFPVLAAV